jgi:hypothetical protein
MRRCVAFKISCMFCIALVLLQEESKAMITSRQSSNCTEDKCTYLPLVIRPIPIVAVNSHFETVGKFGEIHIVGEIRNDIDLPFEDIIVRAKIYKDDQFVQEVQQKAIIYATLPDQLNIYDLYTGVSGGATVLPSIRVSIDVLTTTVDTSEYYRNLKVESISTSRLVGQGIPGTAVTVTVRNNHAHALYNVRVQVWSFDTDSSNNNYYICSLRKCSGNSVVSVIPSGQVYTTTVDWKNVGLGDAVVPPNSINAVAQGTISP